MPLSAKRNPRASSSGQKTETGVGVGIFERSYDRVESTVAGDHHDTYRSGNERMHAKTYGEDVNILGVAMADICFRSGTYLWRASNV